MSDVKTQPLALHECSSYSFAPKYIYKPCRHKKDVRICLEWDVQGNQTIELPWWIDGGVKVPAQFVSFLQASWKLFFIIFSP